MAGPQESDPSPGPRVRPLAPADAPSLIRLVQALADYERLPGPDPTAEERLVADALADPPPFRVLLAESGGRVTGYALFFYTYSTFEAKPTLFLEDLFVLEEERRKGAGTALMRAVAAEGVRHGCGRMEWNVLAWNTPAIGLYSSLGARLLEEWRTCRLDNAGMSALAHIPMP